MEERDRWRKEWWRRETSGGERGGGEPGGGEKGGEERQVEEREGSAEQPFLKGHGHSACLPQGRLPLHRSKYVSHKYIQYSLQMFFSSYFRKEEGKVRIRLVGSNVEKGRGGEGTQGQITDLDRPSH